MISFTRERKIDAAPQSVWAVLADYPNMFKWAPIVQASRQASESARGVGAVRTCGPRRGRRPLVRLVETSR